MLVGILSAFWGGVLLYAVVLRDGALIPGTVPGIPMALAFVL